MPHEIEAQWKELNKEPNFIANKLTNHTHSITIDDKHVAMSITGKATIDPVILAKPWNIPLFTAQQTIKRPCNMSYALS